MPKEREKKREGEKNLRKKRERVKREGKNEFSFAQKRGGPKLTWIRVEGKRKRGGGRKKEGWIARKGGNAFTVYLERIPSIVNDFKPASGAYDRKRVIASREYLIGDSSLLTKG